MSRHHILLVEDSSFLAKVVSDTLADEHGMVVSTAESLSEANEHLASKAIDCVLVKRSLPDGAGIELARQLQNQLPVILFTADDLEPLAAEAIEAGVTEFVDKDDHLTSDMNMVANRIEVAIRAGRR